VPKVRPLKIVTTSWDDGDANDRRIADLLRSTGLRGTFYVPINCCMRREAMGRRDLQDLCRDGFEIGAHSVSHKNLSELTRQELRREVRDCKTLLEDLLGNEVPMFCYPNGRYNRLVIREVKQAGYKGARTTQMLSLRTDFAPFEMPATVQAYPHRTVSYLKNSIRNRNISGLLLCGTECRRRQNWLSLAKELFRQVLEYGGVWHLYGHSWEIEALGIWPDLSDLLAHVSNREGVRYTTNGQLLSLLTSSAPVSGPDTHRGATVSGDRVGQ
jgi:peptidoglycan/xylan/chitin deacetylase (PgdA/CDA1 family)